MTSDQQIQDMWKEIIIKESMKNMIIMMDEIKKDQTQIRQIIREELTNLWNINELPTYKIILEKLTKIEEGKEKNKQRMQEEDNNPKQIIKEDNIKQSEIVPINIWKRSKKPIMVDISKLKPNIPESVNKVLNGLSLLHKEGKF